MCSHYSQAQDDGGGGCCASRHVSTLTCEPHGSIGFHRRPQQCRAQERPIETRETRDGFSSLLERNFRPQTRRTQHAILHLVGGVEHIKRTMIVCYNNDAGSVKVCNVSEQLHDLSPSDAV